MMYCQIVVVPDDVTVNKLPQITGLLAYQKDSKVLRLMKNGTWKEIAEKEVMRHFKSITPHTCSNLFTSFFSFFCNPATDTATLGQ